MKLSDLFHINYGTKLDLNKMVIVDKNEPHVNFISRSSKNLGLVATVKKIEKVKPLPAGLITVTLGGTYLLSAFIQEEEFYTAQNIAVLNPKFEMSFDDKIYYCMCIAHNRFRYSAFGREANRSLKNILVPKNSPNFNSDVSESLTKISFSKDRSKRLVNENLVKIRDIFDVKYGTNLELNRLEKVSAGTEASLNFVSRTTQNNGVSSIVKRIDYLSPLPAGSLTVAAGGSVLETFVQDEPFYTGRDMYYLTPKVPMTFLEKLFFAFCIKANKYRYSYGRQANRTLGDLMIPSRLPHWVDETDLMSKLAVFENKYFESK